MEKKNKKRVYKMTVDEMDSESGVFAISLVESPAIEENFVALSKHHTLELKATNQAKRIVTGPALIPNTQILRADEEGEYYITFDEATIEKASQLYLKRQNNHNTTLEHEVGIDDVYLVESWIVEDPAKDKSVTLLGKEYPKGTWMVSLKIENNEIYNQFIQTGKVRGFSIEANLGHKRINASATGSEGNSKASEGEEGSGEKTKSKEEAIIEELTKLLREYLETSVSITSTNPGQFGTGSIAPAI